MSAGPTATAAPLAVGDRVVRERGSLVSGVIEQIYTSRAKGYPVARVRWVESYSQYLGGRRDHHSTLAVAALRKVETA